MSAKLSKDLSLDERMRFLQARTLINKTGTCVKKAKTIAREFQRLREGPRDGNDFILLIKKYCRGDLRELLSRTEGLVDELVDFSERESLEKIDSPAAIEEKEKMIDELFQLCGRTEVLWNMQYEILPKFIAELKEAYEARKSDKDVIVLGEGGIIFGG